MLESTRMSEKQRIEAALKKAKLPKWVQRTRVELSDDWTGEPVAVVHVLIRKGKEAVVMDGKKLNELHLLLHDLVESTGAQMRTSLTFETASEAA
jgi:hypothetical protein